MKIISSFSGGRTSAYMTIDQKEKHGDDLTVLFANTGQENDETLNFVNQCDVEYGLNVVWLESKINHIKNRGTSYNIVDYMTAERGWYLFEDMIKKYGIPNKAYPHCTRELKLAPIKSWIKDNIEGSYQIAIGYRIDEQERMSKHAERDNLFYPLIDQYISKFWINEFWRNQEFTLNLDDYQGNCKTCFKKSYKKLIMIAKDNPEFFDFNLKMEKLYGLSGHNVDGNKRVFFRENTSTMKLLSMVDRMQMDIFDFISKIDEDENSGCSESCEPFV